MAKFIKVEQKLPRHGRVTREQLAMVSVLMSRQAARHPAALTRAPRTLDEVLRDFLRYRAANG